jgi:hypothetical protein
VCFKKCFEDLSFIVDVQVGRFPRLLLGFAIAYDFVSDGVPISVCCALISRLLEITFQNDICFEIICQRFSSEWPESFESPTYINHHVYKVIPT